MIPTVPIVVDPRAEPGRHRGPHHRRRWRSRYHPYRFEIYDEEDDRPWYWFQTREPLPNLVFIAPLLVAYEVGMAQLGGAQADLARTGVDRWIRGGLTSAGLGGDWVAPLGLVALLTAWLLATGPRGWWFRAWWLVGMAVESVALGLALIGLSRVLDRGFLWLEAHPIALAAGGEVGPGLLPMIGYLGAGLYEEAVFRLALLPALYWAFRIVQAPDLLAGTLAVSGSALAFSIAHHAGAPGEVFTWYAFTFRWLAGIAFAWIFLVRGYGIAVGTHVAYDLLVGSVGWGG